MALDSRRAVLAGRSRPRRMVAGVAFLASALGTAVLPLPASATARPALTGPYQLFCPRSVLGNLVFHAQAKGALVPPSPKPEQAFRLADVQVVVNFPAGFATEMAALSPIKGTAVAALHLSGASPATHPLVAAFTVVMPKPVPPTGLRFSVPAKPASYGPFTATSAIVAVQESSTIAMTLVVKTGNAPFKVPLDCTAFPNKTADFDPSIPWSGTAEPPLSKAISPVIAVSS